MSLWDELILPRARLTNCAATHPPNAPRMPGFLPGRRGHRIGELPLFCGSTAV